MIDAAPDETMAKWDQQFRALADGSSDLVCRFDRDLRLLYANPAVERTFRIPRDRLLGRTVRRLGVSRPLLGGWHTALRKVFLTGRREAVDSICQLPGGKRRFHTLVLPDFGPHGFVRSVVAIGHDVTDLPAAEQVEDGPRERLVAALKGAPVIVAIVDRELRVTWLCDPRRGLAVQEWLGKRPDELLSPESARELLEFERSVLAGDVGATREIEIKMAEGSCFYDVTAEPLRGPSGEASGLSLTAVDVTTRKTAEAALREASERLRFALAAGETGIWHSDLRTGRDFRDAAFNRILGLEPVDSVVPLEDLIRRIHPEDQALAADAFRRAAEGDGVYEAVFRIVRPDGTPRWLRSRGRLVLGDDGLAAYMTGAAADVTGLKEAQDASRDSEERFRIAAERASDLVYEWDLASDRLDWFGDIDGLLGYPPGGFPRTQGQWLKTVHPDDLERVLEATARHLETGEPFEAEYRVLRADGGYRYWVDRATTLRDPHGRPHRWVGVIRDVTELRRLERAKDEFVQVLAHELRNPLAAALGLVQLVVQHLEAEGPSRYSQHLCLAVAELERLSHLTSEMVQAGRVSEGRLALKMRPINVVEVVSSATRPYALVSPTHRLTVTPPPAANLPVLADAGRLVEVLSNLLSNAVKYSHPEGRIWVHTVVASGHVVVRVEDEGIGIPPDQLEKVFEGFYRASNVSDRQPGGLGLGLYVSRDIARRHGGELWAESRPDGGTAMCLRLPLAPEGTGVGDETAAPA